MNRHFWSQKVVLVTGGASGIGRLMCLKALECGASHVIVWDYDQKGIDSLEREIADPKKISSFCVDLSQSESLSTAVQQTLAKFSVIDVLFNNAGIVVGKKFEDHSEQDMDKTFSVNVLAPMKVASGLLGALKKSKEASLINIASAAALVSNPKMSVYCSSKWAVVGWSDSLRLELESDKNSQIQVTTFLPYYINTGMFDGVKSPVIPILNPDAVVKSLFKAVEKKRIFLYTPRILYIVPLLYAILPTFLFDKIVGGVFGVYKSMDEFKGRP